MTPVTMWVIGGLSALGLVTGSWLWQRVSALKEEFHKLEVKQAGLGDRFVNHNKCGTSRTECQTDLKAELAAMAQAIRQQAESGKIMGENLAALAATVNAWIESQKDRRAER